MSARYAHQLTFPDLLSSRDAVIDLQGRMVGGPDCKQIEDLRKWHLWQKAVQSADRANQPVPQVVMNFYQHTKGLTTPPGEINVPDFKPVPFKKAPPFTWSPSKLASFEQCGFKFAAEYRYKTVPYQETVHTIWGNKVHKEGELGLKDLPSVDEEAFRVVEPYVKVFKTFPGTRLIEFRMGLTKDWKAVECPNIPDKPWEWGTEAKGRMTLDLGFLQGPAFKGYDWKSGKQKDEMLQLQIYALTIALLYPQVQNLELKYIWLKDRTTTGFDCSRKDLLPIFKDVKERVVRMEEAWQSENWRMSPSGLCKSWCGAMECQHNGRR